MDPDPTYPSRPPVSGESPTPPESATRSPLKLKPKEGFARSNPELPPRDRSADHDVWAWRQQAGDGIRPQRASDDPDALEYPDLAPQPTRRNRKMRDYLILLIAGSAVLVGVTVLGWGNPMVMVCGIGGIGAYTASLTWVMWAVMGRY